MSDVPGENEDPPNDDLRLMTGIDGEPARLLVHIERLQEGADGATEAPDVEQRPAEDSPGLAQ